MVNKLYTAKGCPVCEEARRFLRENKVKFKELDIEDHPREATKISGSSTVTVPILCTKGKCEIGFSREAYRKVMGKN